ncbi:MAG: flavin-containing monooxygenase [Oceanicaulis sp.]
MKCMPGTTPPPDADASDRLSRLPAEVSVAVIGAGFAGIAMGWRLKQEGVEDFLILDRADGVGGVWRANTYPGAACDVPSHLYSFSFFLNPDWSRKFSPQSEILAYLERAADALALRPHLRFGRTVTALVFDAEAGRWTLTFSDGAVMTARAVVSAVGQLAEPNTPQIKDAERFEGAMVHTAAWDPGVDFTGKRVSVIGNAASAVQLIPEIARTARSVTVFQRTPNWVIEKPDRAFTNVEKRLFRAAPLIHRLYRRASYLIHEARFPAFLSNSLASAYTRHRLKRQLARRIEDRGLREMLTPDYAPGCKRILLSNDYLETLQKPHVRLIARRPARFEPDAILTPDGQRVAADAVIFATGFKAVEFLASLEVRGLEGRTLKDHWAGTPRAYRGVAVSGFPNLFMLYGPNTNLGHNSIIFMLERQAEYVARRIAKLLSEDIRVMDVTPEAEAAFNARLQKKLKKTVWAGDCPSWYKTEDGVITNNWAGLATSFALTLRHEDAHAWRTAPSSAEKPSAPERLGVDSPP